MFSFALQLLDCHCRDSEINFGRITHEAGDTEVLSVDLNYGAVGCYILLQIVCNCGIFVVD